jgi:predicted hydrolase (HD superfamily)
MLDRNAAMALLTEYTQSQSLINHALSVEACMRWYAENLKATSPEIDIAEWAITGLLHDFDYEKYPEPVAPDGHPFKGEQILTELGYPETIRKAIMGHAHYTNTPRDTLLAKALFAVDELSGLITAAVLVRPDRSIHNLEVKSVQKKLKDKAFARGCNRDDIRMGAEELGVPLDQHIQNCIAAMTPLSVQLFGN